MKRRILSLAIALSISVVMTVALFFAAGFAGGACHCMTPVSVLFPYGTFIGMRTSWEALGGLATLFQFPIYAAIIALGNGWRVRLAISFGVLVVHSIAAVGAVTMYQW